MTLTNPSGLSFEFLENGSVKSISANPIRISLKETSIFSRPGTNLYLRKRTNVIEHQALLGPESVSGFQISENKFIAQGSWSGLDYTCILRLAENSLGWQWQVEIKNHSGDPVELDLIYVQDVGLKPVTSGLINEYYVAQYLERRILEDKHYGAVACCRQNMKESTGNPWLMIACKQGAIAATTDGMHYYGKTYRETGIPEGLLSEKLQGEYAGESPVLALQANPFKLGPGDIHQIVFVGIYEADHPEATGEKDLIRLRGMESPGTPSPGTPSPGTPSLFCPFLPTNDLSESELTQFFGNQRFHEEIENDRLLSFFNNHHHIVLKAKELLTDRPHAHIMQAKAGFLPHENIASTTAFMFGVFNSHITQGNTNFNVLLSICTSQFNQSPETGQRIFVELDGQKYLLGVPSAFEMGLNHCRWIYKHGDHIFQVRTWTSKLVPQVNMDFKVVRGSGGQVVRWSGGQVVRWSGGQVVRGSGGQVRLIITHDFDPLNGWKVTPGANKNEFLALPDPESMIKSKFEDPRFRILIHGNNEFIAGGDELLFGEPVTGQSSRFLIEVPEVSEFCMSFIGEVCGKVEAISISDTDRQFQSDCRVAMTEWEDLSLGLAIKSEQEDIAAICEILPWYGMNALTHFLTPYGLEQFGGAAWGTRDVSQGPVEMLLTLEKYDEARKVLCTIFSNQNTDGGWPQWWMFDSYREIRAGDSHGDVFYWCIIALASYIKVTGDLEILEEVLPYYHEKGVSHAEKTPLKEHVDRLVKMITDSFIPGTALVPFGGGDWNDSLQPVSKELAQRMISSWTVEMNFQAFRQYLAVYEMTGEQEKAMLLEKTCYRIRDDFNRHLVKDGIVAGYGRVEDNGEINLMLHPFDDETGVHYSILPMNRGIISGIFSKEQAEFHQDLVEKHLKGPDGARLMDRPLQYRGGIQTIFQRAESSTFFGREIGLMYIHEHIRYAESLARMGKADAFVKALRQAIPVAYRDVVPCGDIRQANCYYSSSDVHFKNRYEADEQYDEVIKGNFTLRGGWRVYSSGPGIFISMVVTRLLGLRIEAGNVIFDPVMPFDFDGLSASLEIMDHPVTIVYKVKNDNFSPKMITINGRHISFGTEKNQYRAGGAVIPSDLFSENLETGENVIHISL
jgi:cellobiose phosphorylase